MYSEISILVICSDIIGPRMAGTAIRAFEIAKQASNKYKTCLVAADVEGFYYERFPCLKATGSLVKSLAESASIIIVQGDALRRFPCLKEVKSILIIDMYCPVALEYHQSSYNVSEEDHLYMLSDLTDSIREQLAYGDYFLYASKRQKDFWFGALAAIGRVNRLRLPNPKYSNVDDILISLSFGIGDDHPNPEKGVLRKKFGIPPDHFVAIWGGGVYEWFDPLVIINAVERLVSSGLEVHFVFLGVKHPNEDIESHDMLSRAITTAKDLGIYDKYVHFNFGWVDYDQRHNYLCDADIGVSAHFDTCENRYAFRTRLLDYIWIGLPVISTRGDFFGDMVSARGIGCSVDYHDCEGWIDAIRRLAVDKIYFNECKNNLVAVREELRWSKLFSDLDSRIPYITISGDRVYARSSFLKSHNYINKLLARVYRLFYNGGVLLVVKSITRRLYQYLA